MKEELNLRKIHNMTEKEWTELTHYEPDISIFHRDKENDIYFIIKRHPSLGYLSGYVTYPKRARNKYDDNTFRSKVHGGITYSGPIKISGLNNVYGGYTFLGFDVNHEGDYVFSEFVKDPESNSTYRGLKFMVDQCEILYKEIISYAFQEIKRQSVRKIIFTNALVNHRSDKAITIQYL